MRTIKILAAIVACGAALYGVLVLVVVLGMAKIPGDGSDSTPAFTRNRGELLRVVRTGSFTIEQRKYLAGNGRHETEFCDYWVFFNGEPIALDPDSYVNQYNSCRALLLLAADEPTFVIGSYTSNHSYVPVIVSTIHGVPNVDRREACAIRSGAEGFSQAWEGWTVVGDQINLCGRDWKVRERPG